MPSAIATRTIAPATTSNRTTDHSNNKIPLAQVSDNTVTSSDGAIKQIRTTCPYCGVGCGVLATVDNGVVTVAGDPDHPSNYGKLCSKGSALAQTLGDERRLQTPYYQDKHVTMQAAYRPNIILDSILAKTDSPSQVMRATDWDTVTEDIAQRLSSTIAQHGSDSVMFYVSGQLLTEDYYVANKLIKGFIGTNNIDSNSRLCMSSAVAGHKRAFGADLVPGSYSDLEDCELLVLIGSNMAWCHPILFGRYLQAKRANPNKKLIVIDPRRTDSCEFADLHLPIAAGTDTHLYNGLLHYLHQHGLEDKEYTQHCAGLDEALQAAKPWSIEAVAHATQVDAKLITAFYKMVADNDKTVSAFSMGVNQSSTGTDKVNAIINTHLLTGRISKQGANPFSLTGQPNAMGGREVGALANLLASHLQLDNNEHRQVVADFWQTPQPISPNVGIKVGDAADAMLEGRIKAIWIMATNPIVSVPEADKFRDALAHCDLVIVSECSQDSDTIRCADIVLPAQGWGEKSGTVTNSERRISRQRELMPATGQAKPDWWIMSQVAQNMGLKGFDYNHVSDVFNEYVALTDYKNADDLDDKHTATTSHTSDRQEKGYPRYLNIAKSLAALSQQAQSDPKSALTQGFKPPLSPQQYDALPPLQWGERQIDMTGAKYKHHALTFITVHPPTDAGSINSYHSTKAKSDKADSDNADSEKGLKLRLITGRLRDQWHTMTRTALAPVLNQQQSEPTITLSRSDALKLGVVDSDFKLKDNTYLKLNSSVPTSSIPTTDNCANNIHGNTSVIASVQISDDMRAGDTFMPIHWSDAFASMARVGALVPIHVDPISGQPELKNSAVYAKPVTIYSVAKIMIHPSMRDAVISELGKLIADSEYTQGLRDDAPSPNLLYSLSRQQNSVLLSVAIPSAKLAATWITREFWQGLFDKITASYIGAKTLSCGLNDELLSSSIMLQPKQKQLRLVVQRALNTDATDSDKSPQADAQKFKELLLAVYIGEDKSALPSTHWLDACFADMSAVPSVKWLLAGRPASGYVDPGAMVCACMSVGENIIIDAIVNQDCTNAVAVGKSCKAGTNCGSCVGQINELIAEYA